ncbi:NACHT domain- and WD repeat-containing protein 1-like [Diadema setosum]|uniref:NACHT domain- and WD repeat-containing protein 1-like n=1 Tax=Diadema setosum TaxID=31175 RepID=UPI003B3A9BEA
MGTSCSSTRSVNGDSTANLGTHRNSHSSGEEKESSHPDKQPSNTRQATQEIAPPPPQPTEPSPTIRQEQPVPVAQPSPSPGKPPPDKSSLPSGPALPDLALYDSEVRNMLLGRIASVKCKLKPRMIRIYVNASHEDSEVERCALMEKVYPGLREYCAGKGYEFEVIDLHWGIWDDRIRDHRFLDQCANEIRNCQILSMGPNFISFLNQKYDRLAAPLRILASAYDRLLKKVGSEEDKAFLSQCYQLDSNATPPVYIYQDGSSKGQQSREKVHTILSSCWGKEEKEMYMASMLETEIEKGVFSPESSSESIIWAHRIFKGIDCNDSMATNYLDLVQTEAGKEVDSESNEQLAQLTKRLHSKVNEGNFLPFEVPWGPKGLDPDGVSSHATYLENFCSQVQTIVRELIDRAIAEQQEDVKASRIHRRLRAELEHHTSLCQKQVETFQGCSALVGQISSYLSSDSSVPLVLHGPQGCGKSALAAMGAKTAVQALPNSACVIRFVGSSPESSTPNQVFRSVCEQIAYLYGEHISIGARGIKRLHKDLPQLLKKVTPQRPLVVIIDGLDQFSDDEAEALSAIPKTLAPCVKMILTTRGKDFDGFTKLQNLLKDSAQFVEIPPLANDEAAKLSETLLKSHRRTLTEDQHSALQDAVAACPLPLFIKLVCQAACSWHSYDAVSETKLSSDVTSQFAMHLETLEKRYGKVAVSKSLSYLTIARDGLSDAEMNDILSCDEDVLNELYAQRTQALRRVPCLLWVALCQELGPFLQECSVNGRLLRCWGHSCFREVVTKQYLSNEKEKAELHKNIQDYFQDRWAKGKKKPYVGEGGMEMIMDRLVLTQPDAFGKVDNLRRFQEVSYHVFHAGEKKFADKYVWDVDWLVKKLTCCDVYDVLEDVRLAQSCDPSNQDLQLMEEFLQLSAYALSCSGSQLFTQLCQRLDKSLEKEKSKYPLVNKLLQTANNPPHISFFPSTPCLLKVRDAKDEVLDDDCEKPKQNNFSRLYRGKSTPWHMVSISPDKGELVVWDIITQKSVRTLTGLDSPRDICFIDSHRVVVLCNRELKIYNLDTGTLQTKLKGLMNQKMPYFSLHDEDHIVALSRNRMYVNIINVTSGETESTFKAGEDRFLNSLLVSANGQRCVCGDETQKPSPLLVWDLNARKLIQDFRIPQHEFVTRMAAISNDGHYVVSVIKELEDPTRNFVFVYDLQSGQLFKKWKPPVNTTCVAISSEGMCVVNGCEDASILVWDLASGSMKHTLEGHTHPVDKLYLSDDGTVCLTYDSTLQDRTIRAWDLQKGACLAAFTPDQPISCCQISADGTCVVIGLPGQNEIISLWIRSSSSGSAPKDAAPFGDPSRNGSIFNVNPSEGQ